MINLLHAEVFKLRKSKALRLALLVTTVCAVLLAVVSHGVATGDIQMEASSMSGLSDIFIMSVLGALMAGIIICNDFDSKNIHDAVACGRWSIVVSKTIAYSFVICLLVLPYAIVSLVGFMTQTNVSETFTFSTYLSLMADGKHLSVDGGNIVKAIVMLVVSLILYAGRLSVCIPIAFKVRKSVLVTCIGVVLGFITDFVVSALSKIDVLKAILKCTPFSYSSLHMDDSYGKMMGILAVSLAFIILMSLVTYVMFKKDEIK